MPDEPVDEREDVPNDTTEIVVIGRSTESDGGGGWDWGWGDVFDFGRPDPNGLENYGGPSFADPTEEPEEDDEEPEIVVTAPPAPGADQSHFADDGDIFNDGAAPTFDTLLAWIEGLIAQGIVTEVSIIGNPDNPDVYEGTYETINGDRHEVHSDGQGDYGDFLRSIDVTPFFEPEFQGPTTYLHDGHWHLA